MKKIPDTEIKNYLEEDDSPINIKKMNGNKIRNSSSCKKVNDASESYIKGGIIKELKKIKKTRFVLETKKEEKNNKIELKRNNSHTKKMIKFTTTITFKNFSIITITNITFFKKIIF